LDKTFGTQKGIMLTTFCAKSEHGTHSKHEEDGLTSKFPRNSLRNSRRQTQSNFANEQNGNDFDVSFQARPS